MTDRGAGATALEHLLRYRASHANAWVVPRWESPLFAGIFPIGITADERWFPVGTAFTISRLGFVATALHNIYAAIERERDGAASLREVIRLPQNYSLNDVGLGLLHSWMHQAGRVQLSVLPLESCNGVPPTDIAFGFPLAQPSLPRFVLPLTFSIPRIGAKVYCAGYANMRCPAGGVPLVDIGAGTFDWLSESDFDLRVVEGRVVKVLLQGISSGFPTGPCVLIDAAVEHGQSGGPVFTEDGFVCGVVSAGASVFTPNEASAVALLYPTALSPIDFGVQVGPLRLNATHSLLDLVHHGDVATDGSEASLSFTQDESGSMVVAPAIHKEDGPNVHDNAAAANDARPSKPANGPFFRVRRSDRSADE